MPATTLRLFRGDAETFGDAPAEDITRQTAGAASFGAATLDRPEAAPRVLPFPGTPAAGDEEDGAEPARAEFRGATLRFDASHDEPATGGDAGFDAAADAADWPDVLPLSAILSHPDSGLPAGYRVRADAGAAELPEGAVAGRVGFGVSLRARGGWVEQNAPAVSEPLSRAKALHANRTCKCCGAGGVAPVLLADTVRDAAGDIVPGSGTLVGFHCGRCEAQWPVA